MSPAVQAIVLVLGGIGALVGSVFGSAIGRQVGQFVRQLVDPVPAPAPARPPVARPPVSRPPMSNRFVPDSSSPNRTVQAMPARPQAAPVERIRPQPAVVNPTDRWIWPDRPFGRANTAPADFVEPLAPRVREGGQKVWSLTPDPGPKVSPTGLTWTRRQFDFDTHEQARFTPGARPLVAFVRDNRSRNDRSIVRVAELPSGTTISTFEIPKDWAPLVLGPEGTYFVSADLRNLNPDEYLEIRNGRTGDVLGMLRNPNLGEAHPGVEAFRFVSASRLIAPRLQGVAVWNLPKVVPPRVVECEDAAVGCSPGGKILLAVGKGVLRAFDLDTTRELGRCTVGRESETFAEPAVSPDGRWIALFSSVNYTKARVQILEFATGIRVREFEGTCEISHPGSHAAEWLPGGCGLLSNGGIYDLRTGRLMHKLGFRATSHDPQLGLGNFACISSRTRGRFVVEPLPVERSAREQAILLHAAAPTAASLPPAEPVVLEGLQPYKIEPLASRTCGIDPSPQPVATGSTHLLTASAGAYLRSLQFAPLDEGLVVVHFVGNDSNRGRDSSSTSWIECYRPTTGQRVGPALDLPPGTSRLLAVGTSGKRLATLSGSDSERIDLWTREPFARVASAVPRNAELAPHSRSYAQASMEKFDWGGFGDDDHLWTLTAGKELTLWKLPEFRAIRRVTRSTSAGTPTFSHTHRFLAVPQPGRVLFLDARSGAEVGAWPLPLTDKDAARGAFSPDGKRFALVAPSGLHLLDLETGESPPVEVLERGATDVQWASDSRLLLTLQGISGFDSVEYGTYDLQAGRYVWMSSASPAAVASAGGFPDGRLWFAAAADKLHHPFSDTAMVIGAALPGQAAEHRIATQPPSPRPTPPTIQSGRGAYPVGYGKSSVKFDGPY